MTKEKIMNNQTHRTADKSEIYAMVSFGHKEREGERNSNVFAFAYSGMVDAANVIDPDIRIEWHGPNAWDPIPEIKAIQELTARQVDGIMVTAADKTALDESVNAAIQTGIPVIHFDADSPASERLTLVATDNYKAGYLAGKTMAEWLGGRGDVAVCTIEHADHLLERMRGFKDALSQYAPQSNIYVTHDSGNIDVDESGRQDFTEYRQSYIRMIQAHPEIRGLFTTYSSPGGGAAEAVEELGLHGKVQILAFDFDEIIIKLVETDKIRATVGQDAYMMGYASMILLHAARHASEMPAKADGAWRAPALADFLDAHPRIHQNIAAKLRDIISRLAGTEAEEAGLIDTGARILGKLELLDILAGDFEDMRDSISEKIEFLGRQVEVRKQAERELRRLNDELEQRVQEREQQVRTSTEVSQEIAAASDLNELFRRVVTLIKERFNFYHAQIFRYDPALDAVVLVTGYGEAGQKMLAAGHKLTMGRGVVGTAAASGQSILATDVTQDTDWRPNPHLPDTKGELAVPIKLRDEVLGILDVQSDRVGVLSADDRLVLEGLCGQIASAMDSTRLLEEQRRSEAELSQALQISKLAYWEYDVEKDLFLFNDQFYAIFHTTADQQGGYQLSSAQYAGKFVYPDDLSMVGSEIERALNSTDRHYSRDLVHRIQYVDGGIGYISVNINIDRDEQGRILRYYGANQDITATKLAELAVRRSEAELSQALQIAKLAYWEYDVEKDLFLFNDQFYAIFHTTAEQEGGYQLSSAQYAGKFVYPDDLSMVGSEIERALNSTDRHYSRDLVHRIQYADGGVGYISVSINIDRDEQGHILRYYGANQDITERKRTEEELARSAQLLNTIINTSRDLIYIKNTKSEFLVASQAVARLVGAKTGDELIGKSDFDFFPYELANKYYTDEQNIIQAGEPLIDIEEPSAYPDGTQIWLLTTKIPYRAADGTLLGLLGIGRDITERKRAEQQMEETLRETERLYAAVSAEGWKTFRQSGQLPQGYRFDRTLLQSAEQIWEPEMAQAVNEEKTEQVALALESARLFDQTQRDANRERTISAISERIYSTSDVKQLMQITAEELRRATGSARAVVRLNLGTADTPEKLAHPDGGSETSAGRTIR
jgi:PAS domain S-box-containing protein